MDTTIIEKKFKKIGARVKFSKMDTQRRGEDMPILVDVSKDKDGEYFDLIINHDKIDDWESIILDLKPKLRHLLLMLRDNADKGIKEQPLKYLCGHDERHWFIAAVPESAGASTVTQAMDALVPSIVAEELKSKGIKKKDRYKRRNAAYIRQGEWFFVPDDIEPPKELIHKDEPISRGQGSSPHIIQYLYRHGGESVYVCEKYPSGIKSDTYRRMIREDPKLEKKWKWELRMRDAAVWAKGTVSHSDHKTIGLSGWHKVLMNSEDKARAAKGVAFID